MRRAPLYSASVLGVLLGPFAIVMVVGLGAPLVQAATRSLFDGPGFAEPYRALGRDPVYFGVLTRTIVTAAAMTGLSLLLAYPTAEFIHRASPRLQPFLLALVLVPLWSSTIARTYGWVGIFVRDGIVDRIAAVFGAGPLRLLYTRLAVVIGMIHVLIPLLVVPIYAALRRYDERLSQASLSLGASRSRTLASVKLPAIAPPVVAASVAVFVLALGFFETPALLGGPDSQLISNLIAQQVFSRFDLPRAQAMSLVLLVAVLGTLALASVLARAARRGAR